MATPGLPLSPDGCSKTFDAAADGYGRGEGCFAVILQTAAYAESDGTYLIGAAVNQDGRSASFMAPNGLAQQKVIQCAMHPTSVAGIETHGTGTALGDPIEVGL